MFSVRCPTFGSFSLGSTAPRKGHDPSGLPAVALQSQIDNRKSKIEPLSPLRTAMAWAASSSSNNERVTSSA